MKAFTTVVIIAIVTLADAIKGRDMRTTAHAINKHAAKRKAHAKAQAAAAQGAIETAKIDEDTANQVQEKKDIIVSEMTEDKNDTESETMAATNKESRHVTLDINEDKMDITAATIMEEQSLSGDVQKPSGNSVLEEARAFTDDARPRRPFSIMLVSTAPEGISQLTEPSHWVREADADGGYEEAKKRTIEMRKAVVTKDHLGQIRKFPVPWLSIWYDEFAKYEDFRRSKTEILAVEPLLMITEFEENTQTSKKLQRHAADKKIREFMEVNGRSTYYSAHDGQSYPVGQHSTSHTDPSYYFGPFQNAEMLLEALKNDQMLTSVYENLKFDEPDDITFTGLSPSLEVLDQFRIDYGASNLYLQIDWVGWRVMPVLEFLGEKADVKQKFQHLFDAAVEAMAERVRLGRLA